MDYQDLVRQIVDAERNAQAIARDTQERQAAQEAELLAEAASIRETAMARAREMVESARQRIDAEAAADLARWDQRLDAAMAAVESADRKHRQDWVVTLFQMIVEDTP